MFTTLQDYYIERNVKILKAYARWREKGKKYRDILPLLSKELEVSKGLINSVCYRVDYPYSAEAHQKVREELAENEKQGLDVSPALAKLVSYELHQPTTVPN